MIVLGVLILVGLTGCGKKGEKSIIGKWQEVGNEKSTMEFFKDGTIIVNDGIMTLTGNYNFIDESRVRIELGGIGELFGAIVAEISSSKDEIVLTTPDEKVERYRRWQGKTRLQAKSERKLKKQKLSKKEARLIGRYVDQKNREKLSLEIKEDRTARFEVSKGVWQINWTNYRGEYGTPVLKLSLYSLEGNIRSFYYAGWKDEEKCRRISKGDVFVSFWRDTSRDWHLQAEPGSRQIQLDKVWHFLKGTVYPGTVEIWDRYEYISGPMKDQILELEKIPNFTPPGWKRIGGGHGKYNLCGVSNWKLQDNKVKFYIEGREESFEFRIKGNTLMDKENGITFVKQN